MLWSGFGVQRSRDHRARRLGLGGWPPRANHTTGDRPAGIRGPKLHSVGSYARHWHCKKLPCFACCQSGGSGSPLFFKNLGDRVRCDTFEPTPGGQASQLQPIVVKARQEATPKPSSRTGTAAESGTDGRGTSSPSRPGLRQDKSERTLKVEDTRRRLVRRALAAFALRLQPACRSRAAPARCARDRAHCSGSARQPRPHFCRLAFSTPRASPRADHATLQHGRHACSSRISRSSGPGASLGCPPPWSTRTHVRSIDSGSTAAGSLAVAWTAPRTAAEGRAWGSSACPRRARWNRRRAF